MLLQRRLLLREPNLLLNGATASALTGGTGCWDLEAPPAQSFTRPPPLPTASQEAAPTDHAVVVDDIKQWR